MPKKTRKIKKIGLIDADLLDNGTRHPNIALMKISAYMRDKGYKPNLLLDYKHLDKYCKIFLSKVFTTTEIPIDLKEHKNIESGGTGFLFDKAPDLPHRMEHHMPDYRLYDKYIKKEIKRGIKPKKFSDYKAYSIGFATRGCFRKCEFCVNKKYDKVIRHTKISKFLDKERPYIYLWDDNILGYKKWYEVFDELKKIGKRFQFRQGLDIRLMTEAKAKALAEAKYIGDYIFAFDYLKDKKITERNLKIWRKYCKKTTKLYLLCAYESQGVEDIKSIFERIAILMRYRCLPYIMRYNDGDHSYLQSEFKGMYINLARWCNQPNFFKKKSFRQYCMANGRKSSTVRYMRDFQKKHPAVAKKYFDMKFEKMSKSY